MRLWDPDLRTWTQVETEGWAGVGIRVEWAVLVTGAREYPDPMRVVAAVKGAFPKGSRGILIHGDARGADRVAGLAAKDSGHYVLAIPYFGDLGPRGGPARNTYLVWWLRSFRTAGVRCRALVFPLSPRRKGSGTWHCFDELLPFGFDIRVYPHHDRELVD